MVVALPPSPATALVVGVTSHRDLDPAQLPELSRQLRGVLSGLRHAFPELGLVVLSPLAEGGDCLVAEVALELGARLVVPLPLPEALYAQDFSDAAALARHRGLLARAHQVVRVPLPTDAEQALREHGPARDRQYLLAGLHVASHCHLLLALWDGQPDGGTGGTAQIVRYYLGGPLPGARRASDNLRQMLAGDDDSLALHLPVRRIGAKTALLPPSPQWLTSSGSRPQASGMPPDYRRIFERMQEFEHDRRHWASTSQAAAASTAATGTDDAVDIALHAVDGMAVHFQRRMLAAMRAIHLLAVLMGLSFLLYSDMGAPDAMLWVFLLFFATGLLIAVAAHRRDWHRKYIDYRALAEGLRVQSFWRKAGLSMTGDPEFAHDNFMQKQDVELGWIRNVMRQAGLQSLPQPADDEAANAAVDAVIDDWVGQPGVSGQLGYYARTAALRERHHLRTQALGAACLWTGVGISLFLALFHGVVGSQARNLLVSAMGALSLLAAVREAYAYRKADKELVKQYRFMHRIYANARTALDAATSVTGKREILRALGEAALAEHAEWALMHRDRPIEHGRP